MSEELKNMINTVVLDNYLDIEKVKIEEPKKIKEDTENFNILFLKKTEFQKYKTVRWTNYQNLKNQFEQQYLKTYGISEISVYDKNYLKLWNLLVNNLTKAIITFNNKDKEELFFIF